MLRITEVLLDNLYLALEELCIPLIFQELLKLGLFQLTIHKVKRVNNLAWKRTSLVFNDNIIRCVVILTTELLGNWSLRQKSVQAIRIVDKVGV